MAKYKVQAIAGSEAFQEFMDEVVEMIDEDIEEEN